MLKSLRTLSVPNPIFLTNFSIMMAKSEESSGVTETKKVVNPRVEIDTSPPFESVKEAVDRFGGSGPWIPHHLLRSAAVGHDDTEEQVIQLERDLIKKEHQTLNILKELEAAKRLLEGLKTNLMPDPSSFPHLKLENHMTGLMFIELNQAKLNLNRTSGDLAVIQASVESLNKKMTREKLLLEGRAKMQIPSPEGLLSLEHREGDTAMTEELNPASFEAEQFKSMTEASRYEVIKAMTEIERTKNSIKMAEMRLSAAKKMEEAAKAVQAIALAEKRARLMSCQDSSGVSRNPNGITLSFEEYRTLSRKAQQAEGTCRTKFMNETHRLEVPVLEKFEESLNDNLTRGIAGPRDNNSANNKVRNESHATKEELTSGLRTMMTSMGDMLSRKVVVQDATVGRHVENHSERGHVSLSQMLKEQSRLILHPPKPTADGSVEKQYYVQRKKFGFIQVPIPTKQSKKKTQGMKMR